MAFYYVKSGGTATGDAGRYATQQTGSFASLGASGYYDTLEDAFENSTTVPVQADVVCVSDVHNKSYSHVQYVTISAGLVVSVDDSNCDQYKPGASETNTQTSTYDEYYIQSENCLIAGVSLASLDYVVYSQSAPCLHILQDLKLTTSSGISDMATYLSNYGGRMIFKNVEVQLGGTSAFVVGGNDSSIFEWFGGKTSGSAGKLFSNLGGNGGFKAHLTGVDLSTVSQIFDNVASTSHNVFQRLDHCKLPTSATMPSHTDFSTTPNSRFEMYNCDDGTGDKLHRFLIVDRAGVARNSDSCYVTETTAWYGETDKSSIEVITSANCSHRAPFIFQLPAQIIDLADSTSDLITIDLVTDAITLTDTDIAAFLVYPDGTTQVQANFVTSGKTVGAGNYGIDPLASGTTLPTSSLGASDWTGEPASPNFYKLELDTSNDAGSLLAAEIRIEIYKPSIAAGDLFIHPLLVVS